MSKTFKIVLILLVVVTVVSAVVAVFAFIGKEREYMKRLLVEDKLAATVKDKARLEKEIDTAKKAKEDADKKIKDMDEKMEGLSSRVEEEKEKNKTALLDLSTKEKEIAKLKADIETERKEKLDISKKLEDLEFDYAKVKTDVAKLNNEKMLLEKRMSDLKEKSVELDKIVVSPSGKTSSPAAVAPPPREPLKGRVLVVNKDYSFIVTDLGQDNGVQKGMIFEIRDDTRSLGKAEVDKIYDTMSSATVLPGSAINNMKKGNLIIETR